MESIPEGTRTVYKKTTSPDNHPSPFRVKHRWWTALSRWPGHKEFEPPYELRQQDFHVAMQDVYDFFYDVNSRLTTRGLHRIDDVLRPAMMSGLLSDTLTASLAGRSRVLKENKYFNGHPGLIVQGVYPDNAVKAGIEGVEIKTAGKSRRCR